MLRQSVQITAARDVVCLASALSFVFFTGSSSPGRRSVLSCSSNSLEFDLDEVDATHRGCHRFVPRHPEELTIEISDPLYVELEEDDLWCEGATLLVPLLRFLTTSNSDAIA